MREKADIDLIRRQNRHIVLEVLRTHGPMPRVELGRKTGLSPASITSITTQLIDEEAMLELDEVSMRDPARRGRPTVRIALNPKAATVIAMKVSIDGIELALADFTGKIIARRNFPLATYNSEPIAFGEKATTAISSFLSENKLSPSEVAHIGIATQGVADTRTGVVAWSPAFKARNVPLVAPIQRALGIPCSLANDANMIAEGVMSADQLRYTGTTAVVYMGYGIGMGLIIEGKVYHGSNGAAAEFGHMNHIPDGAICRCGRAGCIEAYASDYGILRNAKNLPDSTKPPSSAVDAALMFELETAARSGDANAISAYKKAGRAIGFGLARLIALLTPDRIVLSGPGTRALDLIEPSLRSAIEDGVVDELRRDVKIETIPITKDMIVTGTIGATLSHLDSQIFAFGPKFYHPEPQEHRA